MDFSQTVNNIDIDYRVFMYRNEMLNSHVISLSINDMKDVLLRPPINIILHHNNPVKFAYYYHHRHHHHHYYYYMYFPFLFHWPNFSVIPHYVGSPKLNLLGIKKG